MVVGIVKKETDEKLKYPKSVAFIISKEFCERFNYYGMRTILVLYLTNKLGYSDDNATVLFHVFTSLSYFFPIFGAIIADSWLGRFKTILYLSTVYAFGSILVAVGAIPVLNISANLVTIIGLLLISIGTGGIKPCVAAFGGDQFQIPEQAKQLATFFSLFYMTINAGSLISTTLSPILREDVHCFGEHNCFSLAFGVPGILMVTSICIFVSGKPFYRMRKCSGNMIVKVSKCIGYAIKSKCYESQSKDHWLDYAEPKYGKKLVDDVKALLRILVLYIPLPVFWALLDQQGSRWTFQATHMIGDLAGITIKPDQMQVLNPLLIVALIPVFNWWIYPMLEQIGIKTPLQKLVLGMICAAVAFLVSGVMELKLESTYPISPNHNEGQIKIINGMTCKYRLKSNFSNEMNLLFNPGDSFEDFHINLETEEQMIIEAEPIKHSSNCEYYSGVLPVKPSHGLGYFITNSGKTLQYQDYPLKSSNGFSLVRLLLSSTNVENVQLRSKKEDYSVILNGNSTELVSFPVGIYEVIVNDTVINSVNLQKGGLYNLILIEQENRNFIFKKNVVNQPDSFHILWQIPQYVIITIGELMFSVTGVEFSFTQAPASMKSVLQACWLLSVSFGNIIVIIVAEVKYFKSQADEFFLFAGIMAVDVVFFICLAMRYEYRNYDDCDEEEGHAEPNKNLNEMNKFADEKIGKSNLAFSSDL